MARQKRKRIPRNQIGFAITDGELYAPEDLSYLAPDRPAYQCRECGRIWPDLCFGTYTNCFGTEAVPKPICVICQQDIDDAYKREHRFIIKATNVLRSHMAKERDQGLHACSTIEDYQRLTGITVAWLSGELERIYANDICSHCFRRYSAMPNGLADLTVDRPDRRRCLNRITNITFMCRTGNTQKGTTDPRTYDVRQAAFRHVHQYLRRLTRTDPQP